MSTRPAPLLAAFLVLLTATGCRDEKITTYRVPKETPPTTAASASAPNPHEGLGIPAPGEASAPNPAAQTNMANTAVPTAEGGGLTWNAPAHWESRPASAMRKATFVIAGATADEKAELAVTAFPGDVGGNLANLNRWRSQLNLPPIDASSLSTALEHIDVGSLHIDVAELLGPESVDGKPRQRVLGAIVPFNGATWFFKLTGPDALVAAEKANFLAFIQTLKPSR